MKSFLLILAFALLFLSCKEDDSAGVVIDTAIDVSVLSADGLDLLNPQTPNNLTENDIQLFKNEEGTSVPYTLEANIDHPKGIFIFEDAPNYRIRIFPSLTENEEFPVLYVQWGELGMDTLKLEVERKNSNSYQVVEKVWYNAEKVYDQNEKHEERHFVVKK